MTAPIGGGLNSAIFPNQLVTAIAGNYNGKPAALFNISQINEDRWLHRIMLTTTLSPSDLVGGNGGAYWNLTMIPPVAAPFKLFLGVTSLSNMVDLVQIGSVQVGEYITPIKLPANTELWGVWEGVIAASAPKCQATLMFSGVS